jgi:tetratricopeptide (TPR) repeat protein
VVKQAIRELEAGNVLPPGATEKDLVAGIKSAQQRGDTPLTAPLAKGVSLLAGASEQATRWLQQNAKNAALQSELAFYRLREPLVKTPEQRLDGWVARLRGSAPASAADLDEARRDAEWVLANSGKRVPELKSKAELIQALVAREKGGSAQARAVLDRIVKESAGKNPAVAAEASFDLGRIDEAEGDFSKAEALYRQAIKLSRGSTKAASRYRAALARVILRRLDAAPVEAPPAKEQKTGQLSLPSLEALLIIALIGGGEEQPPVQDKRLQEALELANELLRSENREDKGNAHLILGKVYTLQGKKTEGLKEYVIGLQLLYPGLATKDLSRMIETHPAFQQPDSQVRPNVASASRHYGRGLERFWNRRYEQAEEEFRQAVANDPEDARYRYFLGLARYLQNSKAKREAAVYDFEQAATLERFNRPESVAVNASFERLPYSLRQMLNNYRQRSTTPPAEEVAGR